MQQQLHLVAESGDEGKSVPASSAASHLPAVSSAKTHTHLARRQLLGFEAGSGRERAEAAARAGGSAHCGSLTAALKTGDSAATAEAAAQPKTWPAVDRGRAQPEAAAAAERSVAPDARKMSP